MKTAELIEAAFASHCAGELATAEALYRQVLAAEDRNLNALQLLGALVSTGDRAAEAVALLERARAVLQPDGEQPQHAVLYFNLGRAQGQLGHRADAMASYRRGIALQPDLPELHAHLAGECFADGDFAAATTGFETALRLAPDRADWQHDLAMTLAASGCAEAAIAAYRRALDVAPGQSRSRRALSRMLVLLDRIEEAAAELECLAGQFPDDAAILGELGKLQLALNRVEPARTSFASVLALCPADGDAHYMLGRIGHVEGDHVAAEAAYRQALAARPDFADALLQLGQLLHLDRNRQEEAISVLEKLLEVAPDHAEALAALGAACRSAMQLDRALKLFERYLQLHPDMAIAHFQIGWTLGLGRRHAEAAVYLQRAIDLDEARALHHFGHILLGNALQEQGRTEAALAAYRQAVLERPVASMSLFSGRRQPAFVVLVLLAPGLNNTPYDYLIQQDEYEVNIALLLPGFDHDPAMLYAAGDVIFNTISDADRARALLPTVAALADRVGRPMINPPDRIITTDRQAIAALLSSIAGCRVAGISRHVGTRLLDRPASELPAAPFLVRRVGCHNGDDFERVATALQLYHFIAEDAAAEYYLIDYIDYRSADGFFRKYRFFFVDGEILPYHLAIGSDWKVHHVSTDMADHDWMKREEAAFLLAPQQVFGPPQMAALRAIADAVGLDFFGIDCGLDRDGSVVVFEANATMLVHDHNAQFPYRDPHVRRIKNAFGAMLARRFAQSLPAHPVAPDLLAVAEA